jgi:8-oxo-dGTP diphosphatase
MPRVPDGERLPGLAGFEDLTIVVAAAVIERDGRLLVTRRPAGVHLEGFWEFPGGKCNDGESLHACLARELREELAVDSSVGSELLATTYEYANRTVDLHFFRCDLQGEPAPQLGQEMRWVTRDELAELEFPPADAKLIASLTALRPR